MKCFKDSNSPHALHQLCLQDWTLHLESIIADFHNREACFTYSTVSEALSGLFHTAYGKDDVILGDEYNSIYPRGEAEWCTYRHLDLDGG